MERSGYKCTVFWHPPSECWFQCVAVALSLYHLKVLPFEEVEEITKEILSRQCAFVSSKISKLLGPAKHFVYYFLISPPPGSFVWPAGCSVYIWYFGTTCHRSTLWTMTTSPILPRYSVPYFLKIGRKYFRLARHDVRADVSFLFDTHIVYHKRRE